MGRSSSPSRLSHNNTTGIGKIVVRILLAIDTSSHSKHAAQMVTHLATPPRLHILHVVDVGSLRHAYLTADSSESDFEVYRQEISGLSQSVLHEMRDELSSQASEIRLIADSGDPAESIIQTAEEVQADLILLGHRGMTATSAFLLGGVSQKVATYAPCSVLICKGAIPRLDRVLLAVDGSEISNKAVAFLATYPFNAPIQITIMTVWAPPYPIGGNAATIERASLSLPGSAAKAKGEKFLHDMAKEFQGGPYEVQTDWQEGDPPAAILESIQRHETQMVVVGARGLKGIKRFLLGSVSQKILTHAPCSVLIVR